MLNVHLQYCPQAWERGLGLDAQILKAPAPVLAPAIFLLVGWGIWPTCSLCPVCLLDHTGLWNYLHRGPELSPGPVFLGPRGGGSENRWQRGPEQRLNVWADMSPCLCVTSPIVWKRAVVGREGVWLQDGGLHSYSCHMVLNISGGPGRFSPVTCRQPG